MAKGGEFEIVIVREIDRLSRNLAKQLIIEEELKRAGVGIEYVIGDYPDTPQGNFMKHVRASVAEFEREKIRERMTRGRQLKVKSGSVICNGKAPYGYKLVANDMDHKFSLEVNEKEARIVRQIFDWYVEGGRVPVTEIAKRLTTIGVPTPTDGSGHGRRAFNRKRPTGVWAAASVHHILSNPMYATGVWLYGKAYQTSAKKWRRRRPEDCYATAVPSVIPSHVWAAAQERAKQNKRASGPAPKHDYLLSRRARCFRCNHSVCGQAQGARLYYSCKGRAAVAQCRARKWRSADIDNKVWDWVRSILLNPEQLLEKMRDSQAERSATIAQWQERLAVTDDLIASNEGQLSRANELYIRGNLTPEAFSQWEAQLKASLSGLREQRTKIMAEIDGKLISAEQFQTLRQFAQDVAERLSYANNHFDERRKMLDALNVTVALDWENGQWVIYANCEISGDVLRPVSTKTSLV